MIEDQKLFPKLERLAEAMGVENPQQHVAELFEQALDIALQEKDP